MPWKLRAAALVFLQTYLLMRLAGLLRTLLAMLPQVASTLTLINHLAHGRSVLYLRQTLKLLFL
ncbi:hypothetical protein AXX00_11320 [Pseudomonas aeruginosa]|nr:hypothetical protein AXX00_11320 [Pseudomonas aeruginosa]